MAVSKDTVSLIAPELASEPKERFDVFIPMAQRRVDPVKLAAVYEDAVNLLTAHLMTMSRRAGAGGPITAQRAGELSVSYGSYLRQSALMSTSYGIEYWELVRSFIVNPMTV